MKKKIQVNLKAGEWIKLAVISDSVEKKTPICERNPYREKDPPYYRSN